MKRYLLLIMILVLILQIGCKADIDKEIVKEEDLNPISVEVAAEDRIIIDRSENLSDYVVELFGIDDAATIIFNDIALISVVMAYDKELTEETKELIHDIILEKDMEIKQVLISNDEKTFFQVIEIMSKLMNGSPYDSHVGEINKMIDKINKKN